MHRWLYAGVAEPLGEAILLDTQRKLMCAGDWCLGNDVTSALKSADAAWSAAIELLL
jgi:predicted NAD/FAD-dependent oxidoreductase